MKKLKTFSNAFATFLSQYCFNLGLKRFALPQADLCPASLSASTGIRPDTVLPAVGASRPRECQEVGSSRWGNAIGKMARRQWAGLFRSNDRLPARRFCSL